MVSHTHNAASWSIRSNTWQDWTNLVLAIWLFISPWVLQFGAGTPAAVGAGAAEPVAGGLTAAWNAWVLGVIVAIVAISAISRMDFWQEYVNMALAVWIFIAPWVLGFSGLSAASWDHWVVGILIFFVSLSMLTRARNTMPAAGSVHRPPGPI